MWQRLAHSKSPAGWSVEGGITSLPLQMQGRQLDMKNGHSPGTGEMQALGKAKVAKQSKDPKSPALAFAPRLLNIVAAGHYLGISPWSVRELIWAGKLPITKIPRIDGSGAMNRVLIDRIDLDHYIDTLQKEYEPQ